ncbi:MAG: response regulator transcription factor [Bacteroidetes bacterium]|nr:response regulator transcription factor [Bacteroidota bacterium]MBL7103707.1 response regulator transcription factor [Bacteroidales bacterium]
MNVLIIEDEPNAQIELKRLLGKTDPSIRVLKCIDSVEDSVLWLKSNEAPDLIFLDIQLSDGIGFDIFKQVEVKVPVIFTTAYNEYAIQAFRVNSVDYLLKPVRQEDLTKAVQKFKSMGEQFGKTQAVLDLKQIEQLLKINQPEYKERFIAKVGNQIKYINIVDIAYFRAEDNEVMLITKKNSRYIIDYSLNELGNLLDPKKFFRANRSYIVTIEAIEKISKYFNSRLHLELIPKKDDTVLISRMRVPDFLKWMDK